jgi:predicted N-formylglutamate amidohydrolase
MAKTPLLQKGEKKPFTVVNGKGRGQGLIICDHAAARVPKALQKTFGVSKADMKKHIAWDPGAEIISRQLAKKLDMPAVISSYSRLVVDLNRAPEHPESIPPSSDHIVVPGNAKLTKAARQQRLDELFWPYQDEIGAQVEGFIANDRVPLVIAIHSFTPEMDGFKRPWDIGMLWNKEEKIALTFIAALQKAHPKLVIGHNEPYSLKDGRFAGSTIWRHAEQRGIPYIFVEFRQDLVGTEAKALKWGNMFFKALQPVLADPATFKRRRVKK